jgi:5,6,7,8-tetrahydromethanopterin hydro-lyase
VASLELGEGFAGEGAEAAHVNTALGPREGPAGAAFATSLATPSAGHTPFIAVLRPGLPVKPFTLFVNKATIASDAHAELTWGAAQAGVAGGVADAVADGNLPRRRLDDLVLIAAVWVAPAARDAEAVYRNNRAATRAALAAGHAGEPRTEAVLAARGSPWNPFFRPAAGKPRPRKGSPRRRARVVR